MTTPKKKRRNCGCLLVYATIGIFVALAVINFIRTTGEQLGVLPTPTITPTPTVTPTPGAPTATPIPSPTTDLSELTFKADAQRILADYAESLDWFAKQTALVGDNPAIMLTDEWKLQTGGAVASIRAINNEIRTLNPPPAFAASWTEMRTAADTYDRAMDEFVKGVDNAEPLDITRAAALMTQGQAAVNRAKLLLPHD